MRDRMLGGEQYQADESVTADHRRAMALVEEYNRSSAGDPDTRRALPAVFRELGRTLASSQLGAPKV